MWGKNMDEDRQRQLRRLEDRAFQTYKARLKAAERLRRTGYFWNAAQFSSATALIAFSIRTLVANVPSALSLSAGLVVFSVVSLVVSIVVTYQDYPSRAASMMSNYRAIQSLSVRVESMVGRGSISEHQLSTLQDEYDRLLDCSENQTSADYALSCGPVDVSLPTRAARFVAYVLPPILLPVLLTIAAGAAFLVAIWGLLW